MFKSANIKTPSLLTFIVAIVMALMMPMTVFAAHQKMGPPYNTEIPEYGHFGQPHGYVISGDFTFIVETKGSVNRVTYLVYKANETDLDIGKALVNTQQTSVTDAGNGVKYFNLVWNSSSLPDGEYRLYANVHCDSCTPNGWQDIVRHYAGQGYLGFKIDNPEVTPPPKSDPPENTCQDKLERANSHVSKIYEKHKSNLLFVDNFSQQTNLFYRKNNLNIDQKLVDEIGQHRKDVSDNLVALEKLKEFSCQGSLKDQVENYLSKSSETRNKLDQYKDSVIELIIKVLERA